MSSGGRNGDSQIDTALPRIVIYDWNKVQLRSLFFYLRCVVRAVHQIIETRYPMGTHLHEGDGHLTVMHRRGGEDTTDRDLAIRPGDMQFEASPGYLVAIAVDLRSDISVLGQILKHVLQRYPSYLLLQSARFFRDTWLTLFGSSPFGFFRRHRELFLLFRPLATNDGGGVC